MNIRSQNPSSPVPSSGQHLATISHEGRFWDVYLEFEDDPRHPSTHRGLLCYYPGDPGDDEEAVRTTVIFIEGSFEEAMRKARGMEDTQLQALLRSALP